MTNHYLVPKNLVSLKKMFRSIQAHTQEEMKFIDKLNETKREIKIKEVTNQLFTVSFFDGIGRISCKMCWYDLSNAIDFLDNKLKFERTPEIQEKYDSFLANMMEEGKSIYDHILKNEMSLDTPESVGEKGKFTICRNKFPYDFGNHQHFLLWIHPDCDSDTRYTIFNKKSCYMLVKCFAKTYKSFLEIEDKFIIFRNAPINKSVNTIEHFHLISY